MPTEILYQSSEKRIKTEFFDKYNRLIAVTDNKTKMLALKIIYKRRNTFIMTAHYFQLFARKAVYTLSERKCGLQKSNKYHMM